MQQLPEIGQTYQTSWGYDQTNYDFIIVVGFTKSKKRAICQRVRVQSVEDKSSMVYDAQIPTQNTFGDKFLMKMEEYNGQINLRGSYPFCCTGKMTDKRLDTFYPTEKGRVYHETNSQFGH